MFAPSPRRLEPGAARGLLEAAGLGRHASGREALGAEATGAQGAPRAVAAPLTVGVFTDADADEIARVADEVGLDAVQLHGLAGPSAAAVAAALGGSERSRAHHQGPAGRRRRDGRGRVARRHRAGAGRGRHSAAGHEGDVAAPGAAPSAQAGAGFGGSGAVFRWRLVREAAPPAPPGADAGTGRAPLLVAGGIGPDNVLEALAESGAWGVDVSSGVESSPGIKDHGLMEQLVARVKRGRTCEHDVRDSVPTADATCPRPWSRRWRSWRRPTRSTATTRTFVAELHTLQTDYAGRPTPLFLAKRLSERAGCKVYLKREDLAHTGAHKINNTLGQILLAVRMGKKRIIAETGAGQHGVATATVAALFGLECHVYMGEEDIRRQELNVFRMRLLGAEVLPVTSGSGTLKDATNEAIRDWVANVESTHYIIGSVVGPAPYPTLVRDFQSVIGLETREQIMAKEGRLPDGLVACVGAGSNAIGMFHEFVGDERCGWWGWRPRDWASTPASTGPLWPGARGASCTAPSRTCCKTSTVRSKRPTPSPRAWTIRRWAPSTRTSRTWGGWSTPAPPTRRLSTAFQTLSRLEGIIPALESSHAIAFCSRAGGAAAGGAAATGSGATTWWWSACPAGVTKTYTAWPTLWG